MFGWSVRAKACRSASNRATTWTESIPGFRTFRATLRRTGAVCSAMKTTPNPPSPICSRSLYEPMTVPAVSAGTTGGAVPANSDVGAGGSRNPPSSGSAASSPSTRARSSTSPRQASSRYGARSAAGRPRAARKIDSICVSSGMAGPRRRVTPQCDGRIENPSAGGRIFPGAVQLGEEPGPRERPVALGGGHGDAQCGGGPGDGETSEVAELDQLGADGIVGGQPAERLVECEQVLV